MIKRFSFVVLMLIMTACSTAPGMRGPGAAALAQSKARQVLVMDPYIRIFDINAGQQRIRRVEVEHEVAADLKRGLTAVARDTRWFEAVAMPELREDQLFEYEQRIALLQTTADHYLKIEEIGGTAKESIRRNFRGNIGKSPVLTEVAQKTGVRYGVAFAGIDSRTSVLAKGLGIVANAITLGQSSLRIRGDMHALMGIVDFQTGDVLWIRYEKNVGTLGTPAEIQSVLKRMLEGSPLSGGAS
jgi:hypothetical protein